MASSGVGLSRQRSRVLVTASYSSSSPAACGCRRVYTHLLRACCLLEERQCLGPVSAPPVPDRRDPCVPAVSCPGPPELGPLGKRSGTLCPTVLESLCWPPRPSIVTISADVGGCPFPSAAGARPWRSRPASTSQAPRRRCGVAPLSTPRLCARLVHTSRGPFYPAFPQPVRSRFADRSFLQAREALDSSANSLASAEPVPPRANRNLAGDLSRTAGRYLTGDSLATRAAEESPIAAWGKHKHGCHLRPIHDIAEDPLRPASSGRGRRWGTRPGMAGPRPSGSAGATVSRHESQGCLPTRGRGGRRAGERGGRQAGDQARASRLSPR